jgi:phosphoribosylformylglycinamidine cyclo-ligase
MNYNFTDRVRRVLDMARDEAVKLQHDYVGTEHILLGLIGEGTGVALGVLHKLNVQPEQIRELLEKSVRKGKATNLQPALPYTTRSKKSLELAITEARELNHSYVGTEHLLLGLLREQVGIAAQTLSGLGVSVENARAETLEILGMDANTAPRSGAQQSSGLTYRDAGVDREEAGRAKRRILEMVRGTATPDVLSVPGGFGGLFRVPAGYRSPVMVASADGVGTKLKVAMRAGRHDTVGTDLVNHCVNDILVEGARPLFFLDYIGMGRLEAGTIEQIVEGVARGCAENECALLGGETAEMPDFYRRGEYDLAGFIVGIVEEEGRPGSLRVRADDLLIGLASSGFHTNGYSLLRRLLFEDLGLDVHDAFPGTDEPVGDVLLRTHRSYLRALLPLLTAGRIHALAHITGGGIPENLERVLPEGLTAQVERARWTPPPEFLAVMEAGRIAREEMDRTFNMGIGMIAIVAPDEEAAVAHALSAAGETAWTIGSVEPGAREVVLT